MTYGFTLAVRRAFHVALGVALGSASYEPVTFALVRGAFSFCVFVLIDFACGVAAAAWEAFRDWKAAR